MDKSKQGQHGKERERKRKDGRGIELYLSFCLLKFSVEGFLLLVRL